MASVVQLRNSSCTLLKIGVRETGIWLLYILSLHPVAAQETSLQRIELNGELVTIFYSLNDTTQGRTYIVSLYSSKDNFASPLQKVTGDVGIEITPGNKKIVWNAKEEFGGAFEDKIAFEIRSKVYVPFIKLQNFDKAQKRKRGRPIELIWTGGRAQNILRIDLLKGNIRLATFPNIANSGHCSVTLPSKVKYGDGYRLKIYDPKNIDEIVYTQTFRISRRIPLGLKVASGVILGLAVQTLLTNSSNPHKDDIPYFPGTPNN